MISSTGSFLKGSIYSEGQFLRPDIVSTSSRSFSEIRMHHDICLLNKLGYIPLVSTFTGACRSLVAIVHMVIHLARAIFEEDLREGHLLEVRLGAENLIRGTVEMVPLLGNLTIGVIDLTRIYLRWDNFRNETHDSEEKQTNEMYTYLVRSTMAATLDDRDRESLRTLIESAKKHQNLWRLFNPEMLKPQQFDLFELAKTEKVNVPEYRYNPCHTHIISDDC